jgi:hypothetical protein
MVRPALARISENTDLTIPLKNLFGMIAFTAVATMAYFTVESRLTTLEHSMEMRGVEVNSNTEFRIKWPRGELGSLPADARQDMLLEAADRNIQELRQMQDRVHELTIRLGTLEALYSQEKKEAPK